MLKYEDLKKRIYYNEKYIVPKLKAVEQDKLAFNIENCSKTSCIATCSGCGAKYYAGSSYCKSRYCAVCAKLRALAWLCKLVPLLEQYSSNGYKLFMLNFTIKDHKDLDYILNKLMKSWRIMTHDDKRSKKEFRRLNDGGIKSLEIKIGENSGIWHPHIHSIVLLKTEEKVYQYNDYRKLWEYCSALAYGTTDKVGSVDIRGLKGYKGDIVSAVVETFKYMTKLDWLNIPDEQLRELFKVTNNRRFISSWGVLYRVNQQVEALLNETSEDKLKNMAGKVCGCTEFELENHLTKMLSADILDLK